MSDLARKYKVSKGTIYIWLLPIRKELLEMYSPPKKRLLTVSVFKPYRYSPITIYNSIF